MKKLLIIALLVVGCAVQPTKPQASFAKVEFDPSWQIRIPSIGVHMTKLNDTTVQIYEPTDIAMKQGIRENDIFVSIDGIKIHNWSDIVKVIRIKNINDYIKIKLLRNNNIIIIDYKILHIMNADKFFQKILQMTGNGVRMNIALVMGEVIHSYPHDSYEAKEEWKSNSKTTIERQLTKIAALEELLSIVDRTYIDKILNEIKFSNSGLVSQNSALQVGELTGASHLVVADVRLTKENILKLNYKLIEVESGEILISVRRIHS